MRGGDTVPQVGVGQPAPHLQEPLQKDGVGQRIGTCVGNALDYYAERLGDGVADGVLADGDNQPAGLGSENQLLVAPGKAW